jgi:hypothetical protein
MPSNRKSNEVFQENKKEVPAGLQQHMDAIKKMSSDEPEVSQTHPPQTSSQDNVMDMLARDFGIKIPTQTVPLPSAGLLYPQNHPFHNRDFVDIKSMTTHEEDILTSQNLLKKGTVITELIRSCLVDSVNPNDLLVGDRNALMIAIRITGYGAGYDAEVQCSDCGFKGPRTFDLASLNVKKLSISPVQPGVNEFEYHLKHLGVPVRFKFQTGRDEEDILRTNERLKKQGITNDNVVTTYLQHSLTSVNGVTDKSKLAQFVRLMPARDSSELRKYIKDNEPGVDMKCSSSCTSCGHEEEVVMPIGVSFLWPNAE